MHGRRTPLRAITCRHHHRRSNRNGYRVSIRRKHRALFHRMPAILGIVIVIVISELLKRYSKTKRTRAPAYSRALRQIKGGFQRGSREAQVRIPEYQEGTE